MSWLRIAIPVFGVLLLTPTARAESLLLGVVSVQRVMESAPEWGEAVKKLKREAETKKARLEAEQAELRTAKEALDAKSVVSDPSALAPEEAELLQKAKAFQEKFVAAQQEIGQQEARLKDAMLSRVEVIVYELGKTGDYTYIFETGSPEAPNVLFSDKRLDLTEQVIEAYKKRFKDKPLELAPSAKAPGPGPKTKKK